MLKKFQCPFCGKVVGTSADRCPSCGAYSGAFRLLEARLDEAERRLAALEAAIGVGNRDITLARHATRKVTRFDRIAEVAVLVGLPVLILLVMHYALMIFGAMTQRYMLIVAVAVPLPFGLLMANSGSGRFVHWVLEAVALAIVATLGMNGVSALMHGDHVFPRRRSNSGNLRPTP